MADAVQLLRAAVHELTGQRDDLDRQIGVLERTIRELSGETPSTAGHPVEDRERGPRGGRTVREIILELGVTKEVFTLDEVVATAEAEGNPAKAESISSILSRMKRTNDVRAVRRGSYALVKPEAPDESGASVHNNRSAVDAAGPDREEGDGPHGDHRDHHPAPVVGPN